MIHMQKICVPDVIKNLNVKVFNLTYKCKCRLDASLCNNKQCWNNDKCSCECKELIDKGIYAIKDLFGILVIMSVNQINQVILVSI